MSQTPAELSVLILCKDLFFSSQLHGAVQRAGRQGRTCLSQAACLQQLEGNPIRFVIADLELPELNLAELKAAAGPAVQVIAYGPHVREDLFAAAQAAGCDHILTRGQASKQIERFLNAGT